MLMLKRGIKPKEKVKIKWSSKFAYAIGLIATDGNLSSDGSHINFTTKDLELAETYRKCLAIDNKIGRKSRSKSLEKKYFCVQFGDVVFYRFLENIGLMRNKSKKLGPIDVPHDYFFDFLRGCFDGDGCFYSYWDPRWKSSFMFYTEFVSASKKFISWLRGMIYKHTGIKGHVNFNGFKTALQLKYAKGESLKLLSKMYYSRNVVCLTRKRLKIEKALGIVGKTI